MLNFLGMLFFIILLHELGHLLAAKKFGVRVFTYSIGFGPNIIGIKYSKGKFAIRIGNCKPKNEMLWHDPKVTEYRLSSILLGGYCDLAGEVGSTGKNYELATKSMSQRIIIGLSGVVINFLTGLFILFGINIKNFGLAIGWSFTWNLIGDSINNTMMAIYLLCTRKIEITPISEFNLIMGNLGFEQLLLCFALFSIMMAVLNAFPWPSLDGSLPILWLLEKITKGKISKLLEYIWKCGFVLLMILQVIILYFWIFGK